MSYCDIESETKNETVYINIQTDCNLVVKVNDGKEIVVQNTAYTKKEKLEASVGKRVARLTANPKVVRRAKLDSKKYSPTPVIRLRKLNKLSLSDRKKFLKMDMIQTKGKEKTKFSNKDVDRKSNSGNIQGNFDKEDIK